VAQSRLSRLRGPAAKLAAAILAVAVFWIGAPIVLRRLDFFRLRRVELQGVRQLTPRTVTEALKLPPAFSVFDDLEPLGRRVRALPGVVGAEVHRRLPGTLVVEVTEAETIALATRGGRLVPIGIDGKVLPFDPAQFAPDLPVVNRPDPLVAKLLGRVRDVDPDLFARVVTAARVRDDIVLDLGGRRLWLRPDASAEVMRAVMAVERDLGRKGRGWVELDGRFAGQVVVRWRVA
jgi:cell division protein FtsQ